MATFLQNMISNFPKPEKGFNMFRLENETMALISSRITSYNVCYTKLLRLTNIGKVVKTYFSVVFNILILPIFEIRYFF